MINRRLVLFLLPFLLTLYSSFVSAQKRFSADSAHFSQPKNDRPYLKPSGLIVPGTLLIYGGLKPLVNPIPKLDDRIMAHVMARYPGFHTNAADYIMWVPAASIYALDVFKVKTQHSFKEHLIIDAGSIVITGGIGFAMRKISQHIEVYNTHQTEFPSGHTANAFRGAEIVHQELKFSHPVLSYSGYLVATGVGLLRIYNKDHLLSEVLAGAGLGILSTKLTYWIFNKVKDKNQ